MAYIPDPTDTTQPTDSIIAETAQAEFRALKAYIQGLVGGGGILPGTSIYRKNFLINGAMQVWQRFITSLNPVAGVATYTLDRWYFYQSGGATGNYTAAQTGTLENQYARLQVNVAIAAAIQRFTQIVESADAAKLAGKTVTFSVELNANATWIEDVTLLIITGTGVDEGSVLLEGGAWTGQTIAASVAITPGVGTFTRYDITATLAANVKEVAVKLQWSSATLIAGATLDVTNAQLEVGSGPSQFEFIPYNQTLLACQRFFRGYGADSLLEQVAVGYLINTVDMYFSLVMAPQMRIVPAFSYSALADWAVTANGAASACAILATYQNSTQNIGIYAQATAAVGVAGDAGAFQANNTLNAKLYLDSEL